MISIITATKLQRRKNESGFLWQNAFTSAAFQTVLRKSSDFEYLLVRDYNVKCRVKPDVTSLNSPNSDCIGKYSLALNTGVLNAKGDIIAFLEDDDLWSYNKLEIQLTYLKDYDLVTCNQKAVNEEGEFHHYETFPNPSGWIMKRETFDKVGSFNTDMKYHIDTEWLGRFNELGLKRIHLVHRNADISTLMMSCIRKHSKIVRLPIDEPLVTRLVNPHGGQENINKNAAIKKIHFNEYESLRERFGSIPA